MNNMDHIKTLKSHLLEVEDFPLPNFTFLDITPLLERDPKCFNFAIDALCKPFRDDRSPDYILCIESLGYIFGAPMAYALNSKLVLARRAGKLPRDVVEQNYTMAYSSKKTLELHKDAIDEGSNVLIVDDILATGGTVMATNELINKVGAVTLGVSCLVEITNLKGRELLSNSNIEVNSVIALEHQV